MDSGVDFSANQMFPGGRNELVDNSICCPLPVRRRSPGDEDGAHQGIVSLEWFLKTSFGASRGTFPSIMWLINEE